MEGFDKTIQIYKLRESSIETSFYNYSLVVERTNAMLIKRKSGFNPFIPGTKGFMIKKEVFTSL